MTEIFAFAGRNPTLSLFFTAVLVAWIFWEIGQLRRGFRGLSNNELSLWVNRREATLIDLSAKNEFLKGHIPGAINLTADAFDDKKSLARDKPVVVYDRNGLESPRAAAKLKQLGFAEVAYLEGGLESWTRESLPLSKGR